MNQNNTFLWKMLMLRPPEASRGITALETQRTERINEQLLCWSIISLNKYCIILFFFFLHYYIAQNCQKLITASKTLDQGRKTCAMLIKLANVLRILFLS